MSRTEQLEIEKELFSRQYEQSIDEIYLFVHTRLLYNSQATEDIIQEIYINAWLSRSHFMNKSSYKTWICAIAKHKISDYYRMKIRDEKHILDMGAEWELPSNFDVVDIIQGNETKKAVLQALSKIGYTYRYCLIMKYIDDSSTKEIAKNLGKTPKAVERLLSRAKDSFAKEYVTADGKEN